MAKILLLRVSRACTRARKWKGGDKVARKKSQNLRKKIKKTLTEQLRSKGADVAFYADLVDDYMALWDLKEMLIRDIEETGLRTPDGKDSSSPKQLPIVNRQMLATLKAMKLSTDEIVTSGSDLDDL